MHEEDAVAGEAEAVAELVGEGDEVDGPDGREGVGGPEVEEVGGVHAEDEGPEAFFEAELADEGSAADAAEDDAGDAGDAVDGADLFGGESEAAGGVRIAHEEGSNGEDLASEKR